MKIFKVERTDDVDYDQYDAFVIVAESNKKAIELAKKKEHDGKKWKTKEIKMDKEYMVLGSFNAG